MIIIFFLITVTWRVGPWVLRRTMVKVIEVKTRICMQHQVVMTAHKPLYAALSQLDCPITPACSTTRLVHPPPPPHHHHHHLTPHLLVSWLGAAAGYDRNRRRSGIGRHFTGSSVAGYQVKGAFVCSTKVSRSGPYSQPPPSSRSFVRSSLEALKCFVCGTDSPGFCITSD
jgi:hypothetical protein